MKKNSFSFVAAIVTLATINPDGAPQASVVWAKADGDDILISTAKGRRKYTNLLRDPRVNLVTATLQDDPDGTLIEELSQRYTGQSWQEHGPVERVIIRVAPNHVYTR